MPVSTSMVAMRDGVAPRHRRASAGRRGPVPGRSWSARHTGGTSTSRSEITAANRTPASRAEIAAYFTAHGYAVVYQDTRGRYGSEGPLRQIPVRWRGWLRYLRLAARPVVVRWAHLHHGAVVCRAHAGGAGLPRSAGPGGAGAGLRRVRQFVAVGHPPVRRVRAEAGDLGVQERAGVAGGGGRSGDAGGAGGRGHPRVVHPHAVEARPFAAAASSGLRGLSVRPMDARRVRRVLAAARHLDRGLARPLQPRRVRAHVVVVGSVSADRDGQLHRTEARGARAAAADPRAVDAWRPQRHMFRRCGVRAGRAAGCLGRRLARVSAALLRSRGEGRDSSTNRRCASSSWAAAAGGATRPATWSMAGAGSPPPTGRRRAWHSPRSICMAMARLDRAAPRANARAAVATTSIRRVRCRRSAAR